MSTDHNLFEEKGEPKRYREGGYGGGGEGGGEKEIIYVSLHCLHQNDFCIKMGSDESHFNVLVGSDGQSQDSVHKPQPFWRERRAEGVSNRGPSAFQPNALPLGQTGSHTRNMMMMKWCLMSSDVSWHIRDKLRPMSKHGSINLYVHGNQKAR